MCDHVAGTPDAAPTKLDSCNEAEVEPSSGKALETNPRQQSLLQAQEMSPLRRLRRRTQCLEEAGLAQCYLLDIKQPPKQVGCSGLRGIDCA